MIQFRSAALTISPLDAHALVTALAWLRPCAVLAQIVTIAVVIVWFRIALPIVPIGAEIAVLALAAVLTFWRLRRSWPLGDWEALCHVAFDLLMLGWVLFFTGGASNPFITLLLVPVALAAATLSVSGTGFMVLLAAAVYVALMFHYVPLPDMSVHGGAGFRLHLTGMAINFFIAVLLLVVFIGRMTASLRRQREATQRLRERALRDEGILAVATQAAEAAHELNTPLSTLRTLLPELQRGREQDATLRADVSLMIGEVERCHAVLRGMAEYGQRQLSGEAQATTLGNYVRANIARFRLLCPDAEVTVHVPPSSAGYPIEVQPGFAHALLNLMRNAFEASRQNGSRSVTLDADADNGHVEFIIGDHGRGLPDGRLSGVLSASSKPNGLGMGLALARSTIERMRGELRARHDPDGTRICVRLPAHGTAGR